MSELVLSPTASTDRENITLDGLALNDGISFDVERLEVAPPPKRILWLAARDGDALGDVPGYERRLITFRMRPLVSGTMATALDRIGQVLDKLQKAERTEGGIALTWTPAASGRTVTVYVLAGEITGIPITVQGEDAGWFIKRPPMEVRLDCKPFLYGAEVTTSAVTNTDPLQIVTLTGVTGDVPAEGRLVVADAATQERDHVEWGLHTGTTAQTSTDLILDSDELTISGYSGTGTTRSGAYDPGGAGNSVIRGTTSPNWVALCSTGDQTHVGTYRVKARVYSTTTDAQVRLAWRAGDAPHARNAYVTPPLANQWMEVDLGTIYVPDVVLGAQRWEGRIEFKADTADATVDLDVLYLIPAERYGKARAPAVGLETPTVFSARDEFDQTAGSLNAKTAAIGGAWDTSEAGSDADDFSVETAGHTAQRLAYNDTAEAGRWALVGSSVAASTAQVDVKFSYPYSAVKLGAVLRYVDVDNFLLGYLSPGVPEGYGRLFVVKVEGGTWTTLDETINSPYLSVSDTWYTLKLSVNAAGAWALYTSLFGGFGSPTLSGSDSSLVTGGALDDGRVGFYDERQLGPGTSLPVRSYDNFAAWVPANDAAIFSGQSIEFRHDDTLREDSAGTLYGRPPSYRGSRFFIPQAGAEAKVSRVVGKARRNDVDELPNDQIADSTTAQVKYTPRYLAVPRS